MTTPATHGAHEPHDDFDGIDLDDATASMQRVLTGGPLRDDAFLAALRADGAWGRLADLGDDDFAEAIGELLTDEVWRTTMAMWVATGPLLDGKVFTHRVTAAEQAAGVLAALPDFTLLDWDAIGGIELADGSGRVMTDYDAPDEAVAGGHLVGPAGWLDGVDAGDVIGLRRVDDSLVVERIDELPTVDSADVVALGEAFRHCFVRWADLGARDLMAATLDVMVEVPEAFIAPTLPLEELAAAAGFERRGFEFGPADRPWDTSRQAGLRRAADEIAAEATDCCADEFAVVAAAFIEWVDQPPDRPLAPATVTAVRTAIEHGSVAAMLCDLQRDRYTTDDALDRFVAALGGVGDDAATPALQHVVGVSSVIGQRYDEATLAFEAAVALDPERVEAYAELGFLASDRGDAIEARRRFRQAGGPQVWLDAMDHLLPSASSTGRNDPCPCGSGRRFKQCCLNDPKAPVERRGPWYQLRLARHLVNTEPQLLDRMYDVVEVVAPESEPDLILLDDIATVVGGMVDDYLRVHAERLTDIDRDALTTWSTTPWTIERRVSIASRRVPLGDTEFVASSVALTPTSRHDLEDLLDDDEAVGSVQEWAYWYAQTLADS